MGRGYSSALFPPSALVSNIDNRRSRCEICDMPKGVPYRVKVFGNGTRTYTFTGIANGTGLSLSLVSLTLRGKRPVSEYAQPRLANFFGITIEQLGTSGSITAQVPPGRRVGRAIGRINPASERRYGRPV